MNTYKLTAFGLLFSSTLLFLNLTQCQKKIATSGINEEKQITIVSKQEEIVERTAEGYPIVQIPEGVDTSLAYWKGIDITPKPPVHPLSVAEERDQFLLQDGYKMDVVLADPQIQQPAEIAFDGNGRMYVLELRSYMLTADSDGTLEPISGISRWEDKDNDGVYESGGMFVDHLVFPRFVLPYGPDCILTMESNQDVVYKYTDTDKDGKADKREFFCNKYGRSGNVEHQQAFMYWGMDNWLYSTVNPFRVRETADGVIRENTGSNNGQWGVTHDDDGKLWFQGGASGVPAYFQFPIHYGDYLTRDEDFEEGFRVPYGAAIKLGDMQAGMAAIRQPDGSLNAVTGAAGNDIFRGDRLPKELYGQLFYGEPVARIVRRVGIIKDAGVSTLYNVYQNQESEFIRSTDPLFRPVDMTTAPDGSMYITDMYRGIIQEGQWAGKGSYLRVKIEQYQLDKVTGNGRIWRLSNRDFERNKVQPKMFDESSKTLVTHLENPNGWWRDKAQQLLVLRKDKSVVPELERMLKSGKTPEARIHAMWTLEGLGEMKADLLRSVFKDANPRIRMAAMWVSESLFKAGDRSFGADYLEMMNDADTDTRIRAMMTAKMFQVEGYKEKVTELLSKDQAKGVQLVGKQILEPPVVNSFFGRSRPNFNDQQKEQLAEGEKIYKELCSQCHGQDGRGTVTPNGLMAPSFVNNPNVKGHPDYVINTLLHGLTGDIDGKAYEGVIMVSMGSNDDKWVSSIASFIRNSFDNDADLVTEEDVARARSKTASQKQAYQYKALKSVVPAEILFDDNWKVTASHTGIIQKGFSEKPSAAFSFEGWTTGESQKPGMWFLTQFDKTLTLSEIQFQSKEIRQGNFRERLPSIYTQPRELVVEVSKDGKKWNMVWTGDCQNTQNTLRFEPVKAKFVRFTQNASHEKATWTMVNLKFFGLEGV